MPKARWSTGLVVCIWLAAWPLLGQQGAEPLLPDGGFENGAEGWSMPEGSMGSLSTEQAASGTASLKIVDEDADQGGSNVTAARVPLQPGKAYVLRGKVFPVSGSGLGIYPRVLKADGSAALPGDYFHFGAPTGPTGEWVPFEREFFATPDTAFLELWIHSYSHATVVAYLDDFEVEMMGDADMKPPWEGTYKLRPEDTDRLTPADVVGPDGIVYPDWTYAGVPGGIPDVAVKARLEDFGARPGDEDIADALEEAVEQVAAQGGGAISIGPGTFTLGRPVQIIRDGVVIRGAGRDQTRIMFRYAVPERGIQFYSPQDGGMITPLMTIEAHAWPTDLMVMEIHADDERLTRWERSTHSGNSFQVRASGRAAIDRVGLGEHTFTAVAEFKDGHRAETSITATLVQPAEGEEDPYAELSAHGPRGIGCIMFCGRPWTGARIELAEDGKRGDLELVLENTEGLQAGDAIVLEGPATERWKELTRNACQWGTYRRYEFRIESVEGNRVRLNQPLRIEFPVIDGSYVQEREPIRGCGIEDLYIEQTENLWITTVVFSAAWECWARNVTVRMCGRNPIYGLEAKWCEIRDCEFDDAWFKGGGGTAYTGWERCCDCLMENVTTRIFRHGPLYQWAASGNVIRNSHFIESDGQWHSGWTNENLFENCVIESVRAHGAYGYGLWASPPEDTAHGPNGPRNVVYNCDVSSPRAGLWMGGMNENWLILHNRFDVEQDAGIFAKTCSFDHIISGNHFILRDPGQPMMVLQTPDCTGIEATDNRIYGGDGKSLVIGPGTLAMDEGNSFRPLADAPRPEPAVPSIYEWQLENVKHDWE